ncbi:MAG: hypothetical protein FJ318_04120 [SAR202 cluster bacterium]|nr:hypothetical protein [SAR202 cluster bacterium]
MFTPRMGDQMATRDNRPTYTAKAKPKRNTDTPPSQTVPPLKGADEKAKAEAGKSPHFVERSRSDKAWVKATSTEKIKGMAKSSRKVVGSTVDGQEIGKARKKAIRRESQHGDRR